MYVVYSRFNSMFGIMCMYTRTNIKILINSSVIKVEDEMVTLKGPASFPQTYLFCSTRPYQIN